MKKFLVILGFFLLTALPVFSQIRPQTVFPFPQIAVGQFSSGLEFRTQIILTNPSDREAVGSMDFLDDDGRPITLTVRSLRTGQQQTVTGILQFRIQSRVTTVWELTSTAALRAGSSVISTDPTDGGNGVPISGTAAYGVFDRGGNVSSLAGVGASGFVTDAVVPIIDDNRTLNTGVAFTTIRRTRVTFTLRDDNGNPIATVTPADYGAGIHRSMFYTDIFNLPPVSQLTIRSLQVTSDNPIAIISLQIAGNPPTLTTFPVIALSNITFKSGGGASGSESLMKIRHPDLVPRGPIME